MEFLTAFLDYISRTNLFNFIIFLSIIIFVVKQIDIGKILNAQKAEVIDSINNSEEIKIDSEDHLKDVEELVANLEDEVEEIIKKSEENAKLVGEKIIENANKTVESIKENCAKNVENRTALLKNDIMQRASLASVEVAKKHIINELNNNPGLHDKLIDESIEAINEVEF